MTNTELLQEMISAKGIKLNWLADNLHITQRALAMKIRNETEFKPSEISALCALIGVESPDKMSELFFCNSSR